MVKTQPSDMLGLGNDMYNKLYMEALWKESFGLNLCDRCLTSKVINFEKFQFRGCDFGTAQKRTEYSQGSNYP